MREVRWFYQASKQKLGPVSAGEMKELIENGRIHSDTLVCEEGHNEWRAIEEWPVLAHLNLDGPPPEIRGKGAEFLESGEKASLRVRCHPWHRLFARAFDYVIFSCVLSLFLKGFGMPMSFFHPLLFSLLVFFLWIFVEAILLSTWGKTPGKALFSIYVRDSHYKKLTLRNALKRSILVWWFGIAIGLPLISIVTPIIAYVRLSRQGQTYWDRKGPYSVHHGPIDPLRMIISRILIILFLLLLFLNIASFIVQLQSGMKS